MAAPEIITVLLADDHALIRLALRTTLAEEPDIQIVGEAADGEETIRLVSELQPQVVIMDISMPKVNGLEATRQIKKDYPRIAILVLTIHDDSESIRGILEAGAAGYVLKTVFGKEVGNAIRSVVTGEMVLSPEIVRKLLKDVFRYPIKPLLLNNVEKITGREQEILKLAAQGLSNREIADRLNLAVGTVKAYSADLFSKLGVSSRTEAVIKGLRAGLLSTEDLC